MFLDPEKAVIKKLKKIYPEKLLNSCSKIVEKAGDISDQNVSINSYRLFSVQNGHKLNVTTVHGKNKR